MIAREWNDILLLRKHSGDDYRELYHFVVITAPYGAIHYNVSVSW